MEGKCQGNYEAMRVKSNVKSSQRAVTFKQGRKWILTQEVGGWRGRGGARERGVGGEFVNVSVGVNPADPDFSLYLWPRPSWEMSTAWRISPWKANGSIGDRIHHVRVCEERNILGVLTNGGAVSVLAHLPKCWENWKCGKPHFVIDKCWNVVEILLIHPTFQFGNKPTER